MATNSQTLYDYFALQQFEPAKYADEEPLSDREKLRRRKEELRVLIRRVIKNELSEQDRLLVRLHWYQGKSVSEIAPLIGLSRSSVYRRLERINETIYEKLKYAMEYRFARSMPEDVAPVFQPFFAALPDDSSSGIGERLRQSRRAQLLSSVDLCRAAGLSEARLQHLERHGGDMTVPELKALTKALGISSDALIFGADAADPAPGGKGLLYG